MTARLLMALALACGAQCLADDGLPWKKDYATALAKARSSNEPVFLMLTATWCGPCKMLEQQTLPTAAIRSGLKDFVWVKAYEDKTLNEKFGLNGYPTLVFLDSTNERVLEKSVGYEPSGSFLRHVIAARTAAGLLLTDEMKSLLAKEFKPDEATIHSLTAKADADGLVKYLSRSKDDELRDCNYLIAKLRLPPGIELGDVLIPTWGEFPLPASGVFILRPPREEKEVPVRITVPGCKSIEQAVPMGENAAVGHEFAIERLAENDAASWRGRVLRADGQPASNAIVRVCDWGVTHADGEGRFRFARLSPGAFTVRGEAPGGEFQQEFTFVAGQELKQDIALTPVTTIGIRWVVQSHEGSQELTGEGARAGEAYFSVEHSRFLISRGAEVRQYFGSDFMFNADWKGLREFLKPEQIASLENTPPGTPIFWLFDTGMHPNGLHREARTFEEIREVKDGASTDKSYFKFLRGEAVRKGQVYTLRCTIKDCYAKMEITDVTLAPIGLGQGHAK